MQYEDQKWTIYRSHRYTIQFLLHKNCVLQTFPMICSEIKLVYASNPAFPCLRANVDANMCCVFALFGCYLCRSMYSLCVNVYCHQVTTRLQLINISYHIQHPTDVWIQNITSLLLHTNEYLQLNTADQLNILLSQTLENFIIYINIRSQE